MKLTDKQKKVIDIIQWICIILLLAICITNVVFKSKNNFISPVEYEKETTYVKIYESQKIESLKKENKELYDSIKKLNDVESAVEIRYKYRYLTDTIREVQFVHNDLDSIYHYVNDNDTIKLNIDVKASELKWLKSDFSVNDKFMIINREKDGNNQLFIDHSDNVNIEGVDAWHRIEDKEKWYKNFHFGVQVGAGYGLIFNKPDIYVGVGISYTIK